jgi:hypothetical protein
MQFRYFLLLVSLIYGLTFVYYGRWNTNTLYGGDAWGYYAYLPALFIYGDLHDPVTTYRATSSITGYIPNLPEPGGELHQHPNGNHIIKYTCGVALFESPFFALGHLIAGITGVDRNGYTLPYRLSVHLGVFLYLLFGLYLLYRVMRGTVRPAIALLSLSALVLGTNLHYYSVYNGVMAHTVLFFLYTALLYCTVRIYRKPEKKWAILLGLSAGCIILIRPVELICLLIPLLYGVGSRKALHERAQFLRRHRQLVLLTGITIICCGFPQLLYWKYSTGHFLYYSYADEGFNWLRPKIIDGLLSYKNGWLTYTPVMIMAAAGIYFLFRRRDWLLPVLSFLPLHIYITYSWWCWYYNGFGSRPMVEAYALLAIPLAFFLEASFRKKWSALIVSVLLVCCSGLNLFQTYQTHHGVLLSESANRGYYWSVFGKTELDYGDLVAFDCREEQPDSSSLQLRQSIVQLDFEDLASARKRSQNIVHEGKNAAILEPWDSMGIAQMQLQELNRSAGKNYLMISAMCYKEILEWPWYEMPYLAVRLEREGRTLRHRTVYIDNKLGNPTFNLWGGRPHTWGSVQMYVHIPDNFRQEDRITIYAKGSRQRVYLDEIQVSLYEQKP